MHDPHTRTDSLYFNYPIFPFTRPPEMEGKSVTHPVVIAGGGPSGLIAALELARFGIQCVVIEADETVSEGSRAACVSRRSMEILRANGVDQAFLAQALPWTHGTSYYREHEVFRLSMPYSEDERFYPMANLQQNMFEALLVERAQALGVEIRWRSKVAGVRQHGGEVELDIDTPEHVYTLRARYVIAADGARSELRRLLNLKLNGESHEGRYLIADIRMASNYPTERRAWFDPASNPGKSVLVHKMARDMWRVDYALDAGEDEETEMQEARVKQRIKRHLDYIGEATPWTLDWIRLYKAHCLCLDDYRHGNLFFIGDAAHLVPIFGVRGMNSSMADANNLGWKLAAVLHRAAPDALLDSYSPERRAATLDVFANAAKSTRFMTPPTRGYTLLRDAAHLVPIFGVRGMNSSMADANNLGWKLAAVLHGDAPDALLDSYSPERRAATLDVFANAAKSTRFMTPPTRGYTLLRDAALQLAVTEEFAKQWINPRQSAPYDYVASALTTPDEDAFACGARPGAPMNCVKLADGSYLTDHVGGGFTLLVFGDGGVSEDDIALPAHSSDGLRMAPTKGFQPSLTLHRIVDTAALRTCDAVSGSAYLVRPDGHVCARWRQVTSAKLGAALERVLTNKGGD